METQAATDKKLAEDQERAAGRFGFFQKTRNALSDLCGMLREKVSGCGLEQPGRNHAERTSLLSLRWMGSLSRHSWPIVWPVVVRSSSEWAHEERLMFTFGVGAMFSLHRLSANRGRSGAGVHAPRRRLEDRLNRFSKPRVQKASTRCTVLRDRFMGGGGCVAGDIGHLSGWDILSPHGTVPSLRVLS